MNETNAYQQAVMKVVDFIGSTNKTNSVCVKSNSTDDVDSCLATNRKKEPVFREFIYDMLDNKVELYYDEAIISGAEHVGVSPVTAKRYLEKMLSALGNLKRVHELCKNVPVVYKPGHDRKCNTS